jgi:hypothetical protein
MVFDYCCSLGLQPPELPTVEEMESAVVGKLKLVNGNANGLFFIGETFVDGQHQDVWCNSKVPITNRNMHFGGSQFVAYGDGFDKSTSCYLAYYAGPIAKTYGLILYGNPCVLSAMSNFGVVYFLCV